MILCNQNLKQGLLKMFCVETHKLFLSFKLMYKMHTFFFGLKKKPHICQWKKFAEFLSFF